VESAGFPCHWISLGELGRLIEILKRKASRKWSWRAGEAREAIPSIRPDWKLVKLLMSLPARNTDGLIGAW